MTQRKILLIANDFTTIYHFRMELLCFLVQQRYDVYVALPDDTRNALIAEAGVKTVSVPINRFGTNPFADLRTMLAIRKLITSLKPMIVLTYTAKPNIYGGLACRLTKTPYVCNITGLGANFDQGNLISRIMLVLQKHAYKSADTIFFQNSSNWVLFKQKHIIKGNGALLPGSGVNLEENCYEPYPHHSILKFIVLARIRKDKGYDELFEVIQKLYQNDLQAEFHIVGWYEDDRYKETVQRMRDLYGVQFYENVLHNDVHALIAECDCLIQPSHHEGMSNVILEAAATGRPCIVSDIPGCREGVTDGETGFYFTVKNSESLYHCVVKMIGLSTENREQMGMKAHEKMKREFDRNTVVQAYAQIIKKYEEQ
jgi:galacturonosyltransferase